MVRLLSSITLLVGLLYCSPLIGQVKNAGLWTSAGFEFKLVKKGAASISEGVRYNENIRKVGTIITDFGVSYKYKNHFQFAVG